MPPEDPAAKEVREFRSRYHQEQSRKHKYLFLYVSEDSIKVVLTALYREICDMEPAQTGKASHGKTHYFLQFHNKMWVQSTVGFSASPERKVGHGNI